MPFASSKQERFMFANHPDIAKRWASEFGSFKSEGHTGRRQREMPNANVRSTSEESPNPGVAKLPRPSGQKRDFAHLRPSAAARFSPSKRPSPNLQEADREDPVGYVPNSRHRELGTPKQPKGLHGRDHHTAIRKGK